MSTTPDEETAVPEPITWRTLGADEAMDVWQRLDEWVRWWIKRYGISSSTVPPCWYLHPRAVEELSALWTAWELWFDPLSPANGPLTWHREAEAALVRLKTIADDTNCTINQHLAPRTESWPTSEQYAESFAEFVEGDVQERQEQQISAAMRELDA